MEWAVLALPAFLASLVEFVEAYTIVLAVGVSRGWRAPLYGVVAAVATLAMAVAAFGVTLVDRLDERLFELVVGTLLLLFGLRWLRKAILRSAGLLPLHDEDAVYRERVAALAAGGRRPKFDTIGFLASYKAMLLEGLEVVFIVLTLGASSSRALTAASVGAAMAFAGVGLAGAVARAPLSKVPENTLKALVGVVLTAFGVYWSAAGLGADWPGEGWALLGLIVGFAALAFFAARAAPSVPCRDGGVMRRAAAAARSLIAALVGLLIDDLLVVVGTVVTLVLTWTLSRTGRVPASALGFVVLAAVVATLAASLRRAARATRGTG